MSIRLYDINFSYEKNIANFILHFTFDFEIRRLLISFNLNIQVRFIYKDISSKIQYSDVSEYRLFLDYEIIDAK